MPFLTDEQGVKTSKPIEVYIITIGSTIYRRTFYHSDVVFGGDTYTAIAGQRSNIPIVPQGTSSEVTVSLDVTDPLIQLMAQAASPEMIATCRILRTQGVNSYQLITGNISDVELDGEMASFRVSALTNDAMRTMIPSFVLSLSCMNTLYDGDPAGPNGGRGRCPALRADHDFATTVGDDAGTTLVVASVNSRPDGWYKDGEIWVLGTPRLIISQVGTTLEILQPFPFDTEGQAAILYDGCDRAIVTCRDDFNAVHGPPGKGFVGHPYFKSKNPFINRLAWDE